MPLYYANDFTFDLPDTFKDKTHHILSEAEEGPSPFNIVIARTPVDTTETLGSYQVRLLNELPKALAQFELLAQSNIEVAALPALQIDYRWINDGLQLSQRQVSFIWDMPEHGPRLVQITATARGDFTMAYVATLDKLLTSMQLRRTFQ